MSNLRLAAHAAQAVNVLLTGASGFVGSHILDELRARNLPVTLLLRPTANTRFIQQHLASVRVSAGGLTESSSLDRCLDEVTHVIHCAGLTRATRGVEFMAVNRDGVKNLVEAINIRGSQVRRLVHISSLAAVGPSDKDKPLREDEPPRPVSEYGRSKLAGEQVIQSECQVPFVILRPPGVYGPRDTEFLRLYKTIQCHCRPLLGGGRQVLSLVHARDLARAAVQCLDHPAAENRTYFVANREPVTTGQLADEIARQMGVWTLPLPLPAFALWTVCAAQEIKGRLTGRPSVLNRQKYAELIASGWVCDASRLAAETEFGGYLPWREGIGQTLAWYQAQSWL